MARRPAANLRSAIEQALAEQADNHDGEPTQDRRRQRADDLDGTRGRRAEPDHPGGAGDEQVE